MWVAAFWDSTFQRTCVYNKQLCYKITYMVFVMTGIMYIVPWAPQILKWSWKNNSHNGMQAKLQPTSRMKTKTQ